jgi:outer membrane protein OmpA-like peptidoglycan-associated protein
LQRARKIWHLCNGAEFSEKTAMKKYMTRNVLLTLLFAVVLSTPLFGQVDVARRTTAITYPLDEIVMVQFRGTTRFPRMKGEARVRRTSRNGTEIDLSVSKMPRPFELGAGYATYVLWAISPEGHIDNLGEIKRRGFFEFDSRMSVTTRLQTFALIITAEPHFLVRRPSQEIMLENLNPYTRTGQTIQTMAAVQYFGNSSDYFRDSRTPEIAEIDYSKTPSTILQGRQAIALARFAGAERDAEDELMQAENLLKTADDAWKAGRPEETVDITARQAISTAVKAESTAIERRLAREKRNEQTRTDAEIRSIEDKLRDAENEIAELKKELAGETRNRELSQRDVATFTQQIRDLRAENSRLSEELGRAKLEANNAKARLDVLESERRAADEQKSREERWNTLQANQPALIQSLRKFGTVVKNDRGIVVTLPENIWSATRTAQFAPNADTRISELGSILTNNADYSVIIEAHTDDLGNPEELTSLTQQRAGTLADRLTAFGVPNTRIEAKGMGATLPVARNTTNANRAKNRRVNLILVPSI